MPDSGPDQPASPQVEIATLPGEPVAAAPLPGPSATSDERASLSSWERYEIFELLGRGGMGEVYRARDRRLGRIVALKFIRGADPDWVMRLLQEARAQARIDHPNICKVYEVGEVQGRSYIAMQFVEGQRLDRLASSLSQPEKLRILQEVASAIHEAHRQGVIHRDLKPANILVERGEKGRPFPVVMDFGLAYDTRHGHGLTVTGALMGTPSYMAPEQARGELGGIDRRTDVYSLGATLYELLAGVAPFTDSTVMGTLAKVLHEEPISLHSIVPHIERDLEIIVLKCLSKEPQQRYPSARALAEDLARFLDGEPIVGRRPSLPYRLRRLARKHRALVAVSAASLATILIFAAFGARAWLEARRATQQSEARARLAEQLGQELKEIEWFLRVSYAAPLHDTRREQQLVRERMARIAAQQPELDHSGAALVHYTLGRGHLALHEFEQAHQELLRAQALGLDSPELHYALGRVLGELYHQALEEARHSGDKDWLAQRQQQLSHQYLEPALQSLERSRGLELESPRYLEGLIAFYRREYDVAARAAAQASVEAPWMPETWKLAGDVARAQAVEQPGLGYDAASTGLQQAVRFYERASDMGRSDALNHEALAEVWLRQSELDEKQGKPQELALRQALAASERAIQAAPDQSSGYTQKAYALMRQYQASLHQSQVEDLKPLLDAWIATGRHAVALNAHDVSALDALGIGYSRLGEHEARSGQDPSASWSEAIRQLTQALELQPNHPWALNDLGVLHLSQGRYQWEHGQDPRPAYGEAIRRFEQAVRIDPKYLYAYVNLGSTHSELAAYALERGSDPREEVGKVLEAEERGLQIDPNYYWALDTAAVAEVTSARYLIELGQDPLPALERARQYLERSLRINAAYGRTHLYQAEGFLAEAAYAAREGHDPLPALEQGRQAVETAIRYDAGCVGCRVERARLELIAAEWEQRQGGPGLQRLQQARSEARRAVDMYPYVDAHLELARADWRWAEEAPTDAARSAVTEGLEQVEQVLGLNPALAEAHALRGGLLLVQTRWAGRAGERRELLLRAQAAFARAIELNPLLRSEYEGPMRETEARLAATREAAR